MLVICKTFGREKDIDFKQKMNNKIEFILSLIKAFDDT